MWAGKKYQKTAKGWRPVKGDGNKAVAKEPDSHLTKKQKAFNRVKKLIPDAVIYKDKFVFGDTRSHSIVLNDGRYVELDDHKWGDEVYDLLIENHLWEREEVYDNFLEKISQRP